jgi:putative ABC transport system permease protein
MLKNFYLSMKLLWREWRAGEWYVVFIALFLAVTVTTAIHFYTDRLIRGLDQQGTRFLGGDLVVSSSAPIPEAWINHAYDLRLRTAQVWSYPSVVTAKNHMQLVNLQAVSNTYPLIGNTFIHPQHFSVFVEPRLLSLLAIKLNDAITIGTKSFQAEKLLTPDMDTLNTGWSIAPRVMISLADVLATKTVIPGSRIDYRLLLAGEQAQIAQFKQWLTPQLNSAQKLLDMNSQQSALRTILQRADSYLRLVLLVCLLMSGVAIAMSIQQYLRRHYAHVALWRCLGAGKAQIRAILVWQLFIIGLFSGLVAVMVAYFAQGLFANLFSQYMQFTMPAAGWSPVISGLVTSMVLLFTFAWPALSQLPRTSPLFIWRNELILNTARNDLYVIISMLAVLLFVYWFTDFSRLTLYFLSVIIICAAVLYVISRIFLALLRLCQKVTDGAVRRGISELVQHPGSVSLQFIGFNLIIIALITLGAVRGNILNDWHQSLSSQTPNYFAFNIAPDDLSRLKQVFAQNKVTIEGLYPMVRGRLIALNKKPVLSAVPVSQLGHNALHRDLNLSWMWQYPSDNKIVSGQAWAMSDASKPLVSVENKMAQDLQFHLGDELTFQIGDQQLSAKIDNLRSVEWGSFHPNFFMIFPPGLIQGLPTTYITSFYLSASQASVLDQLVQLLPNITVIDVASLLLQIQGLVNKIALAMQYIFLFALGAGILIFITCLQASMDERRQTYRLLRVLGAGKKYIRTSMIVEFGCLALLVLLSSVLLGYLGASIIEQYIFSL